MRVKKLGIEWGAAFEEAEAHSVQHYLASFEFYVSEKNELVIELPNDAKIEVVCGKLLVTIPA